MVYLNARSNVAFSSPENLNFDLNFGPVHVRISVQDRTSASLMGKVIYLRERITEEWKAQREENTKAAPWLTNLTGAWLSCDLAARIGQLESTVFICTHVRKTDRGRISQWVRLSENTGVPFFSRQRPGGLPSDAAPLAVIKISVTSVAFVVREAAAEAAWCVTTELNEIIQSGVLLASNLWAPFSGAGRRGHGDPHGDSQLCDFLRGWVWLVG